MRGVGSHGASGMACRPSCGYLAAPRRIPLPSSNLRHRLIPLRQPDQRIAHGYRGRGGSQSPVVSCTDAALGRRQFRGELPCLHPRDATMVVLTTRESRLVSAVLLLYSPPSEPTRQRWQRFAFSDMPHNAGRRSEHIAFLVMAGSRGWVAGQMDVEGHDASCCTAKSPSLIQINDGRPQYPLKPLPQYLFPTLRARWPSLARPPFSVHQTLRDESEKPRWQQRFARCGVRRRAPRLAQAL